MKKLSVYRHTGSGEEYFSLLPTNLTATKDDYPDSMTYINIESGNAYSRKAEGFEDKFVFVRDMTQEEKDRLVEIILDSK